MKLTPAEEMEIRLLSDGQLYREALTFVKSQPAVQESQLFGLLEFSRTIRELNSFIKHQKNRDWGEPGKSSKAHYLEFYTALDAYLEELNGLIKEKFISDELTRRETSAKRELCADLLAREFIKHLAAEMMRQAAASPAKEGNE